MSSFRESADKLSKNWKNTLIYLISAFALGGLIGDTTKNELLLSLFFILILFLIFACLEADPVFPNLFRSKSDDE